MTSDGFKLVSDVYSRFHSSRWQSGDEFKFLAGSLGLVWFFCQTWDGLSGASRLRHTYRLLDRLGDADGRLMIDSPGDETRERQRGRESFTAFISYTDR